MRIGVFFNWQNHDDWERFNAKSDAPQHISDQAIYDEEIELASLVEPLGFDSYWSIDHYASPYGMTGGTLQHLSFIAGRTSRIDVGTMVVVLPWYDPFKLAHEISVLDNVLQGRKLTLGVGRGAAVREFDAFRVPMADARGRYDECLEILRLSMSQEWFSYDGEHFKIPRTTVRPKYRNPERLLAGMKSGWASPASLPLAANAKLGMLLTNQKSWEDYRADVVAFNRIRAERDWAPAQPTVVVRAACFETEEEAWENMSRFTLEGQRSSTLHYQFDDPDRFANTPGYEQYAKMAAVEITDEMMLEAATRPQAWGTPDQVYERLLHIQRMTGAEEFVLTFKFGTMPAEIGERSMRLFASEVLPRLHAFDATLNDPELAGEPLDLASVSPGE